MKSEFARRLLIATDNIDSKKHKSPKSLVELKTLLNGTMLCKTANNRELVSRPKDEARESAPGSSHTYTPLDPAFGSASIDRFPSSFRLNPSALVIPFLSVLD
jgi:hypothetical protein